MMKLRSKKNTPSTDTTTMQLAIAEIAAESWRYRCALKKVLKKLDVMDAERFSRQYEYFSDRVNRAVSSAGLTVRDLTGQAYNIGLPVQAMNLGEFDEDEPLIITQTIEPVIILDGRVLKTGLVMVDRIQKTEEEQ